MAHACALAKDLKHAGQLYALLLPWQGRNLVAASMVMCYGPADRLLGMLCTILERWDSAARHFDAAIAMNERQGSKPWLAHTQFEYAVMLAQRKQPGDRERAGALLASALEIAEALDMAKIRDAASRLKLELDERPRTPSFPGGLSRREAEVLRMVASGKSNQEIAAAIFRSPNTVAKHVSSILGKLGAANRTEAATFAARHGLL
jgi:DNA-binding CsgD family transcriptional regulator